MKMPHRSHVHAFTLVELSIVLVILGLLVGGVLTGQTLIRAAELRSATSQEQRYITAVQAFRDKYFALPGDMTNAQSYWGVANATPATCITTSSATALTCNGDGNGMIDVSAGANERFRFWQHLASAGLIEGSYTGVDAGTNGNTVTSANSPIGRIGSSLFYAYYVGPTTGSTVAFDGEYGNAIRFGGYTTATANNSSILRPEEAYNMDMKTDDGKPATGAVVIRANSGIQTCTDTSSSTNMAANYLLSSTALTCTLFFRQAF